RPCRRVINKKRLTEPGWLPDGIEVSRHEIVVGIREKRLALRGNRAQKVEVNGIGCYAGRKARAVRKLHERQLHIRCPIGVGLMPAVVVDKESQKRHAVVLLLMLRKMLHKNGQFQQLEKFGR